MGPEEVPKGWDYHVQDTEGKTEDPGEEEGEVSDFTAMQGGLDEEVGFTEAEAGAETEQHQEAAWKEKS